MNKLSMFLSFCLVFVLFSSCAPDLTDDVEWAYDVANNNTCSEEGAFKCSGKTSYKCESKYWVAYEYCDSGCDSATGQCIRSDSESSSDSCTTIDSNMWSPLSSSKMDWNSAVSYCHNLTECGYSDWHLPTISELRTLIQNCPGTVTGGSCGVTDSCLSSYSYCRDDSCNGCPYSSRGYYSKLRDDDNVWSSSTSLDTDQACGVGFYEGVVGFTNKSSNCYVRCVR